jgi:predicted kinase
MNISKLKEPWVMILIGPPNSGKDTWIKSNDSLSDAIMISRDQILLDVWGEDNYDEAFKGADQKLVDRKLNQLLIDTGKSNSNVIVNMTHMGRKRRMHNLSFFPNHNKIAVIFPILTDEEYKRRNLKRQKEENKFIPESVIKSMISSYQSVDKKIEGFDRIISI